MLATCGGKTVCVTNCRTGRVVMKYTHLDEPSETFQSLAWTVVKEGNDYSRVMAVAGALFIYQ